jgi:hypothetical protein
MSIQSCGMLTELLKEVFSTPSSGERDKNCLRTMILCRRRSVPFIVYSSSLCRKRNRRAHRDGGEEQKRIPQTHRRRFLDLLSFNRILHISAMEIDAVENEIYYFISSSDSVRRSFPKNLICSFKVFFNCYRETFPIPSRSGDFSSV